jgi:UDP-N-acetylglucosamine 1-carboxyvinyltransferase
MTTTMATSAAPRPQKSAPSLASPGIPPDGVAGWRVTNDERVLVGDADDFVPVDADNPAPVDADNPVPAGIDDFVPVDADNPVPVDADNPVLVGGAAAAGTDAAGTLAGVADGRMAGSHPGRHYRCHVSDAWLIEPNGPLHGEVTVHGSKNAVTKHMVAALLGSEPSTISNVPDVGDVEITARILRAVGATVERDGDRLTVAPPDSPGSAVPLQFSGLNRIPVLLLGPLLHLTGEAWVPRVGGDQIGNRPIDFHVDVLRALGAEVEVTEDGIAARCTRLKGAILQLPFPSVGATESALLTGAMAEGKTVIRNAATEPEVLELALLLQRMGARIELAPDRRIIIEGVPRLRGSTSTLQGDRNEAFSYLVAGLLTGGRVTVRGCSQDRLVTAITTLLRMGAEVEMDDRGMTRLRAAGATGRGRADRRAPGVHDRLADPLDGAVHAVRRHVGPSRDGL